jgi:hypothetical protein
MPDSLIYDVRNDEAIEMKLNNLKPNNLIIYVSETMAGECAGNHVPD